jgi:hypothetical protein
MGPARAFFVDGAEAPGVQPMVRVSARLAARGASWGATFPAPGVDEFPASLK